MHNGSVCIRVRARVCVCVCVLHFGSGDRYFLQSHHRTFLGQGSDGNTLQSPNRGGSEQFKLEIVAATSSASTSSSSSSSSASSTPAPPPPPVPTTPSTTGKFFLTHGHGAQLSATGSGHASSPNRSAWESFEFIKAVGDKVIIVNAHGQTLSVSDSHVVSLSKNRSAWEQFSIQPAGNKYSLSLSLSLSFLTHTDATQYKRSPFFSPVAFVWPAWSRRRQGVYRRAYRKPFRMEWFWTLLRE